MQPTVTYEVRETSERNGLGQPCEFRVLSLIGESPERMMQVVRTYRSLIDPKGARKRAERFCARLKAEAEL